MRESLRGGAWQCVTTERAANVADVVLPKLGSIATALSEKPGDELFTKGECIGRIVLQQF